LRLIGLLEENSRSRLRNLVFGVHDFDETLPAVGTAAGRSTGTTANWPWRPRHGYRGLSQGVTTR
jgi:hypothetical protein